MAANDRIEDGRIIPELQPFSQPLDGLRPEDLRPMAKDLGLSLNPEDPDNLARLREILRLEESDETRLKSVLQGGVSHQVLNARKHTEESMIIAGAGAFGAVTIATNMAGRGVDIKLGGDLAEEIVSAVNRVLRKAGIRDPYDLTDQERRLALQGVEPSLFGIYEAEVKAYLQHFEDMARVRELGGLYVIGSERHEARRIDNQLRGRAARQGDPGASRFYLSLEDDLMRIFGGEQVKNVMERFSIDEDYPLQARMVSNMIEGSQHRVEGANFDVRKHTLEYDDVLNAQRMRIYSQRNRVFEKENLAEDVDELLGAEVSRRVQEAVDAEETWRLLAWLEQIQPPIQAGNEVFPSFTYRLLLDELNAAGTDIKPGLIDLAARTLETDHNHFLTWALEQLDHAGESLEAQAHERMDDLDTFLDALRDRDETDTRRPQEIVEELAATVRTPLRLTPEQSRLLLDDPQALNDPLREQISTALTAVTITRLAATIEFRFGEALGVNPADLQQLEWDEASVQIEERVRQALEERKERLLGEDGQIVRDLESAQERVSRNDEQSKLRLLMLMAQGSRAYFDARTHRQMRQVYTRLHYIYFAAELLKNETADSLEERVLEHLQGAQAAQRRAWQEAESARQNFAADSPQADEFGGRVQNQIYRQVLLGAITELWVDYLTRVEALRVAIGLEAYAQRDPLVQYKSQASEMFQNLLAEIRSAVVSRIFLYRPRISAAQEEPAGVDARHRPEQAEGSAPAAAKDQPQESGKKRKRHRH
jgi:preprotein translocase subunit SecA